MGSWLAPLPPPLKTTGCALIIAFFVWGCVRRTPCRSRKLASLRPVFRHPLGLPALHGPAGKGNASCLERNQGLRQIHRLCREPARQCPRFSEPGTGIAPELYSCAVALGLEKAWGARFAGLCLGRFHEGRTLERGCLQQVSAQGRPVAASTARLVLRLSQIFQAGRAVARCMRM